MQKKAAQFQCPKQYPRSFTPVQAVLYLIQPKKMDTFTTDLDYTLNPIKLDYQSMIHGLKFVMYQYLVGAWRKTKSICYLELLSVKESIIHNILYLVDTQKRQNQTIQFIISHLETPAMWSNLLTLYQFIETPMHLIFEGLVKSSIELLIACMRCRKK